MTDVAALYERLPHAGSMCLLDDVLEWGDTTIHGTATSHRDADNPLTVGGRLPMLCALEYAAQACGLHGVLLADRSPDTGIDSERAFIAIVNSMDFERRFLDECDGRLDIRAEVVLRQSGAAVYRFAIECGGERVAFGQVGLMS